MIYIEAAKTYEIPFSMKLGVTQLAGKNREIEAHKEAVEEMRKAGSEVGTPESLENAQSASKRK